MVSHTSADRCSTSPTGSILSAITLPPNTPPCRSSHVCDDSHAVPCFSLFSPHLGKVGDPNSGGVAVHFRPLVRLGVLEAVDDWWRRGGGGECVRVSVPEGWSTTTQFSLTLPRARPALPPRVRLPRAPAHCPPQPRTRTRSVQGGGEHAGRRSRSHALAHTRCLSLTRSVLTRRKRRTQAVEPRPRQRLHAQALGRKVGHDAAEHIVVCVEGEGGARKGGGERKRGGSVCESFPPTSPLLSLRRTTPHSPRLPLPVAKNSTQ